MTAVAPRRRDAPTYLSAWSSAVVIFLAILVAAGLLLVCGGTLTPWELALLGTGIILPLPVGLALGALRRLGPVLPCELLRCGRRERYVLFRCLYGAVLVGVLAWSYLTWFSGRGTPTGQLLWGEGSLAPDELPKFAAHFFTAFLAAQLVVVLLLTPIYVGGAIAEERERRTLEFLLATDLAHAEIVVSKLLARLLNLALLLLTGLPVLALTQLWGGVDPFRVAAGFGATGLTMLSVGSLALLNSVVARHAVQAVLMTYGQLAVLLVFGCAPGLSFGHPLILVGVLTTNDDATALLFLAIFALIHLLLTYLLTSVTTARLQYSAFAPATVAEPEALPSLRAGDPPPSFLPPRPHPPVGDRALLWKELYAEPHWRWDQLHPVLGLALLCGGVCVGAGTVAILAHGLLLDAPLGPDMNAWVRWVGTPLAGLLVLLTAFYAAGAISRERERLTLDSLLTVPANREAILATKWRGGFFSTRQAWWCLAQLWVIGVLSGGVHVLALPLMLLGFAVYAAFVTSLGLFCSTVCTSTLRATLATMTTLLALGLGSYLLWSGQDLLFAGWLSPEGRARAGSFLLYGLTPPLALWPLAFGYGTGDRAGEMAALAGLTGYAGAALVLWRLALARFRGEAGPAPRRQRAP